MPHHDDEPIGTVEIIIPSQELPDGQTGPIDAAKLFQEIRAAGAVIARVPNRPPEMSKGAPDLFYLTLPTVVALREVAKVIKAWLHDRPRVVQLVEVQDGKVIREYRVTGAVSDDSLHEILSHAVRSER
jgi:hypothetical protein